MKTMLEDRKKPQRNLTVWLPLLFALVLVAGMMIGMRMQYAVPTVVVENTSDQNANGMMGQGKIEELLRYIEAKYVDEVDREKLINEAIGTILEQLDPHSNYITAEQLREVNEQLGGSFDGIGVEFMILEDTVVVIAPLAGGPSEAAGILAGDKIVQVEDSTIAGVALSNRDVMNLLRGEKGSEVKVGILRGEEKKVRFFTITRDAIPMNSVDIAYMLDNKTGYIKVNRFSATTYEEFMKNLERLIGEENMEDLVIDLRHNPGGYLQQATNILSQLFREKNMLLVYTEGRAVHRNEYESTGRSFFDVDDIVVLIDEGSASASEILAGALQDHDRAYIVGRRSFGKGLVQEQYQLRDGSALRLTVARYYTPSGRSIQKPYDNLEAYQNDMADRLESGELSSPGHIAVIDSTHYFTDSGRVVYGGGGIIPDVYVPLDTSFFNETYLTLRQHVPQYVFQYMKDHERDFAAYDLASFKDNYRVPDALFDGLVAYARKKGVTAGPSEVYRVRNELVHFLKAHLARHLFDDVGFFAVWNAQDGVVQEALRVLNSSNPITEYKQPVQH